MSADAIDQRAFQGVMRCSRSPLLSAQSPSGLPSQPRLPYTPVKSLCLSHPLHPSQRESSVNLDRGHGTPFHAIVTTAQHAVLMGENGAPLLRRQARKLPCYAQTARCQWLLAILDSIPAVIPLLSLGVTWAISHILMSGSMTAIVPAPLLAIGTGVHTFGIARRLATRLAHVH
eukprot:4374509-Pleurochrysis_carterae.AAC.2